MKVRKLKSIRLVLIIIAVLLSLAIAAVRIFWIPAAAEPEIPPRENGGVSSSQSEQESTSATQPTTTSTETMTADGTGLGEAMPTVPNTAQEDENSGKDGTHEGNTLNEDGYREPETTKPNGPSQENPAQEGSEQERPAQEEQEGNDMERGQSGESSDNGTTVDEGSKPTDESKKPEFPFWGGNQKDEDDSTERPEEPSETANSTVPDPTDDGNMTEKLPDEEDQTNSEQKNQEKPDTDVTNVPSGNEDGTENAPGSTVNPETTTTPDASAIPDGDAQVQENDAAKAAPENSGNADGNGQNGQDSGDDVITEEPNGNVQNEENNAEEPPAAFEEGAQDEGLSMEGSGAAMEQLAGGAAENAQKLSAAEIVLYVLCGALAVDIVAIVVISVKIKKKQEQKTNGTEHQTMVQAPQEQTVRENAGSNGIQVGQLHNIGARPYQEDSSGVSMLDDGILAIVADGMGGLSGGDKVSQKIVYTMLGYGDQLRPGYIDGALERMVHGVNETVNNMLGPDGLYKSGSTLLAVLARGNRFHWIAVGDSHIYYFHNGRLVQLNEEHNRGQELLHMAARGEITYEEARNAPKKNGLTSFIGMGKLKYVDKSLDSIPLVPGDRILLMTDGVFNALPDQTIEAVMNTYPNVQEAAAEMERLVIQRANPRQDIFTAVIIGF